MDFLLKKQKLKEEYEESLAELKYYEKIYKKFKKSSEKGIEKFDYTFLHLGLDAPFAKDNELKIAALAKEAGYDLIDEKLFSDKTVYYFQKTKTT